MPSKPTTHPSREVLVAFGLGKLNEADLAGVAEHLEGCPECSQAVVNLSPDSFIGRVRAAGPAGSCTQLPVTPPDASPLPGRAGLAEPAIADVPAELADHPKFRILKELGRGGMGVVYKAENRFMEMTVALKVINKTFLDNPEVLERFDREVRTAARLVHPHIVRALDADRAGEWRLLVMEFVEGASLFDVLRKKGPLPVPYACHYARQAALGLQYAHDQGMVHRDVKPHNLMLTPRGQVKILDFGLARLASEQSKGRGGLTRMGDFMGTPDYVAPEQAMDASKADIRADLYSLGCTLYFLLAGRPPFQEDKAVDTIMAHLNQPPPSLLQFRSNLPAELWTIVARLLAKDPKQRFQTPREVADALAPFTRARKSPNSTAGKSPPAARTASRATMLPANAKSLDFNLQPPPVWGGRPSAAPDQSAAIRAPAFTEAEGPGRRSWSFRAKWAAGLAVGGLVIGMLVAALFTPRERTPGSDVSPVALPNRPVGLDHEGEPVPPIGQGQPQARVINPRQAYRTTAGDWKIEGNELVQGAPVEQSQVVFGDFTWTDYDLFAEVNQVRDNGHIHLLFRVSSAGHNAILIANEGASARFKADCWRWGRRTQITERPGGMARGRWCRLRVRVRGPRCQCFIDDREVLDYEDARNTQGAVGFQTCKTSARFQAIRVTDPSGKVLLDGLPDLPSAPDWSFPDSGPPSAYQRHCLKGHGAPVVSLAFSRDGRHLLSSSNGEHRTYENPNQPRRVGNPGCTVRLWDVASGKELACSRLGESQPGNGCVFGLTNVPGSTAFLSAVNDLGSPYDKPTQQLRLWEIVDNRLQSRLLGPETYTDLWSLHCTSDGRRFLMLNSTGSLWEWDLIQKKLMRHQPASFTNVKGVAIAPDSRTALLTLASQPGTVIDLATGQTKRTWTEGGPLVQSPLLFTPDGRKVLSGGADGSVYLRDAVSGKELHRFSGHQGPIHALALTRDGRHALSGSEDGVVYLLNLEARKELACFTGHTQGVLSLAFSPDGRWAASGGSDYTVRVWRLPPLGPGAG